MAQNVQLLAALNIPITGDTEKEAFQALMQAGLDPASFRTAVINHRAFWITKGLAIAEEQGNNEDFVAVNGDGANANANENTIAALHKRCARSRVLYGLRIATDELLHSIITAANQPAVRTILENPANNDLFGSLSTIAGWGGANSQTTLDNAAIDDIKQAARQILLLKKIEASADFEKISTLYTLNDAAQVTYAAAALELGVPDIVDGDQNDAIRRALVKKHLILYINRLGYTDLLLPPGTVLAILNEQAADQFKAAQLFNNFAQQLNNDDINAIKNTLGSRYLIAAVSSHPDLAFNDLVSIAATAKPDELKGRIKNRPVFTGEGPNAGAYIDGAFEAFPALAPSLRQAAAINAIMQAIVSCEDLAALDALIRAQSVADIRTTLANYRVLGFADHAEFPKALTDHADIKPLIAEAHMRRSLLKANQDQLKTLIINNNVDLVKGSYREFFAVGEERIHGILNSYLDIDGNRFFVRQEMLLKYIKATLSDTALINNESLGHLVNGNGDQRWAAINVLLDGNYPDAQNLVVEPLVAKLQAVAAAETVVRQAAAMNNFLNQRNHIIARVNSDQYGEPHNALIQTLSLQEKNALKARLVHTLVSNYQATNDTPLLLLNNLAKAENLTDFNQALQVMGLTYNWANEQSKESIQQAAAQTVIKLQVASVSQFNPEAHTALYELIALLPTNEQKKLLDKPLVIKALVQAQDLTTVQNIIGDVHINTDNLINENRRLAKLTEIENAEVVMILSAIKPPVDLKAEDAQAINAIINGHEPFSEANFVATVNAILQYTLPASQITVAQAFGLNQHGLDGNINIDLIRININAQRTHNNNLIQLANRNIGPNFAAGNTLRSGERAVNELCLRLKKTAAFSVPNNLSPHRYEDPQSPVESDFLQFKQDLAQSENLIAFIEKAATREYINKLVDPDWKNQLTPQIFKEVKRELSKQAFQENSATALEAQAERIREMNTILDHMQESNDGIHKQIKALGKTSSIEWLNPAFEAAARQNTIGMTEKFEKLADICNSFVRQCQLQIAALENERDSLPASPSGNATIETRRQEINQQIAKVKEQLDLYLPAQRLLNGNPAIDATRNPLMHQGILKTLKQIKEGKKDLYFPGLKIESKVYPLEEKTARMRATVGPAPINQNHIVLEADGELIQREYESRDSLFEPGTFCEHTVPHAMGNHTFYSRFIEERNFSQHLAGVVDPKGEVKYIPSIKLTAVQFPQQRPAIAQHPAFFGPELENAKIEAGMAMAMTLLRQMANPPSPQNRLKLGGGPDAKYVYEALIFLGKDPNLNFDARAIKVISKSFQATEVEKKFLGFQLFNYPKSDFYKQYESNPAVAVYREALKEANKAKVDGMKEMKKQLNAIVDHYEEEPAKHTLEEIKASDTTPKLRG